MAKIHPPGTPRVPSKGRQAAALIMQQDNEDNPEETVTPEEGDSTPTESDPTVALKEQIAALERSNKEFQDRIAAEQAAAAEARKRAQERDTEVHKLQEQTMNSQQEAIDAALAAATNEADIAQSQIETALSMGDGKAMADAQRRLSRAEARILTLENGKEAIEREIKERPQRVEAKPEPVDPLENFNIPPLAKNWLRSHPDYLNDARKNARLQALHWDVVDEGYDAYSKEYFDEVEYRLKMRQRPALEVEEDDEPEPAPAKRPVVSAPPSREVPESNTGRIPRKVTLSRDEKEAARISGITEEEYIKQKIVLMNEKNKGNYVGGQ